MPKTITFNVSDDFTLSYGDFTLDPATINEAGLRYLIQYGYSQSLQDAVAGASAKLKAEMKDGQRVHSDVEVAVMLHDKLQARHNAIQAGEAGSGRVGPRVSGVDKIMQDVAWETIRAHATKTKSKLPQDAAGRNALIGAYLAKYEARTRAEAERRMAAVEEIEINLPAA